MRGTQFVASKSAILVAATAPSDTAVTTCLRRFALTSPTAYKPFVLVWQSLSVITYPDSSISAKSLIRALFGTSPIATNTPSTVSVLTLYFKRNGIKNQFNIVCILNSFYVYACTSKFISSVNQIYFF